MRTNQYKFIRTHGVWDINQLYDLKNDPYEVNNLIRVPEMQQTAKQLNDTLWNWLEKSKALEIPLKRISYKKADHLHRDTW